VNPATRSCLFPPSSVCASVESLTCRRLRWYFHAGPHFLQQQVLDWILQLGLALHHIHERRILHRDVKTKNVFLSRSSQGKRLLKLGDFGIARTLMDTAEQATSLAGSPLYMSPECLQCHGYGPKSDLWAFGVVV
jgi:serine/threonine protein kinase